MLLRKPCGCYAMWWSRKHIKAIRAELDAMSNSQWCEVAMLSQQVLGTYRWKDIMNEVLSDNSAKVVYCAMKKLCEVK